MSNYEFEIKHADKTFKQYSLDNEKVIGVEKNEPFTVILKNNSSSIIQVRISLDGTDIVSGKPASLVSTGKMWLVQPYDRLELSAWPESDYGGSQFVFTNLDGSVAANTHGNTSGVGLIAAAVYIDADPPYSRMHFVSNRRSSVRGAAGSPLREVKTNGGILFDTFQSEGTFTTNTTECAVAGSSTCYGSTSINIVETDDSVCSSDHEKLAVGAGDFTQQAIVHGQGLNRPMLDEVIQIRYASWHALQKDLRKVASTANAFPGEQRVDLRNVPKVKLAELRFQ